TATGTAAALANYSFTLLPGTLTVGCTATINGGTHGRLDITKGVTCLNGGTYQTITVSQDAGVRMVGTTVKSQVDSMGASVVALCSSQLGLTSIQQSFGPVLIGSSDKSRSTCGSSTTLTLSVTDNHDAVDIFGNGGLSYVWLDGNLGTSVFGNNVLVGILK